MKGSTSICVLNWNGKHFLAQLIPKLIKYCSDYEIVIIDNGSSDGSEEFIKRFFINQVTLISFDKNYGFAEAYNKALNQLDSDYCIILNNDVYINYDFVKPVLKHLTSTHIFAVGSKMLSWNKKSIDSAGVLFPLLGMPLDRGRGEEAQKYSKCQEVFSVCGGAMAFKLHNFKKIGGFRKEFFAYFEDVDLCHRARLLGLKIIYEPTSIVYHFYGGASQKVSNFKLFLILRNSIAWQIINFEKKNLFPALLASFLLRICVSYLYLLTSFEKTRIVIRSLVSIIQWKDYLLKERKRIQVHRKIKDKKIFIHRTSPISEIRQLLKQL